MIKTYFKTFLYALVVLVLIGIAILPFILIACNDNGWYLLLLFITVPFSMSTFILLLRKVDWNSIMNEYDNYDSV